MRNPGSPFQTQFHIWDLLSILELCATYRNPGLTKRSPSTGSILRQAQDDLNKHQGHTEPVQV